MVKGLLVAFKLKCFVKKFEEKIVKAKKIFYKSVICFRLGFRFRSASFFVSGSMKKLIAAIGSLKFIS